MDVVERSCQEVYR